MGLSCLTLYFKLFFSLIVVAFVAFSLRVFSYMVFHADITRQYNEVIIQEMEYIKALNRCDSIKKIQDMAYDLEFPKEVYEFDSCRLAKLQEVVLFTAENGGFWPFVKSIGFTIFSFIMTSLFLFLSMKPFDMKNRPSSRKKVTIPKKSD